MLLKAFFVMDVLKKSNAELVSWLHYAAALQESHPFHSAHPPPDWIPAWGRFRQHAVALTNAIQAAQNKDQEKTRELKQERSATLLSIILNATYIVMRSLHEENPSLRHSVGYTLKEMQQKRTPLPTSVRRLLVALKVKRNQESGSVIVIFTRNKVAALYQLQICKGVPQGEDSWGDEGGHKSNRVKVHGLEPANWYYFRGRIHGDNETSNWSEPVSIIIT